MRAATTGAWRWLTVALLLPAIAAAQPSSTIALVLNIPACRLDMLEDGRATWSAPVAVGMSRFPTPRGEYTVSDVEWHPWWIPPDRPWARKEHVTPPGPDNPMGKVKLNFRPLYFLHGTPFTASIGRAASHGCVRMRNEDATALARAVLRVAAPALDSAALERMIADSMHTSRVPLTTPVPITLRYDLVEVIGDRVYVYPDVYHLGTGGTPAIRRAVAAVGWDSAAVDTVRARALLRKARVRPASMTRDSLMKR